jgi:acyl carrier protein
MALRSLIISEFESVASERKQELAKLSDDLVLVDSGLDSLSFAVIVARLEDQLGVDPFSSSDAPFPATLREFIVAYETAQAA